MTTIPLFPLHTVLFPRGRLQLQIFEARYVDMVGRCLRERTGFGVALIVAGREAGGPAKTVQVGTLANIIDFDRLPNGLLGVTAVGAERFTIVQTQRRPDGLNVAEIEWRAEEVDLGTPAQFHRLAQLARQAFPRFAPMYGDMAPQFERATWLGMRLAEMLPLEPADRQHCLELDDPLERLRFLDQLVKIEPN